MLMVELLFNIEQGRRKAALDAWENEGGRVAADSAQKPFSIVRENGVQGKLMPQYPYGADAVRNSLYAADRVSPDVAGQSFQRTRMPTMQRPPGSCAAPHCRPSQELDFAGAPLSLPHEGLELRLGMESAHEVTFSADARAVVRRTTEDTAHAIRNDGTSSYPPETQPIST